MRILFIEDDAMNRRVVRDMLSVADNLSRALAAIPAEVRDGLHHLARSAGAQVVWIDRSELPRHKVQLDIQGGRPEAP